MDAVSVAPTAAPVVRADTTTSIVSTVIRTLHAPPTLTRSSISPLLPCVVRGRRWLVIDYVLSLGADHHPQFHPRVVQQRGATSTISAGRSQASTAPR